MKRLLIAAVLLLIPAILRAQQSVQGTPNGYPVAVTTTGSSPAGVAVSAMICSGTTCYTSPVAQGALVIASGSTSTIFASTTGLLGGHCNNQAAASVNLTVTDGNNAYVIGPNFVVPSLAQYDFPPGLIGQIMTSGLKASASAATAIVCWITGKQ